MSTSKLIALFMLVTKKKKKAKEVEHTTSV